MSQSASKVSETHSRAKTFSAALDSTMVLEIFNKGPLDTYRYIYDAEYAVRTRMLMYVLELELKHGTISTGD